MQNLKTITVNAVTLPHGNQLIDPQFEGQQFACYSSAGITFFTRRGLAKLSKSAGTPQAWAMMDTFIDAYFTLEGLATGSLTVQEGAAEAACLGLPSGKETSNHLKKGYMMFAYGGRGVTLYTRRGLAKISKTIGSPQAWAMMDTFIDAYFTLEGLATGSLTVQEGAAKAQEMVKRGSGLLSGIALKDTPALPDGDHLRTAMTLPVNRMATCARTFDYIPVLLLTLHFFYFGWTRSTLALQVSPRVREAFSPSANP